MGLKRAKPRRMDEERGSVTHMESDRGFIYNTFGLGASHKGFLGWAGGLLGWALRKSLPSPAHGLGPTAHL